MDALTKSFWVGLGAFVGGNLRFWLGEWLGQRGAMVFPWATFAINVIGSLAIGIFYACELKYVPHFSYRLFVAVGVCGGFTTFSTFSWESLRLMERGEWTFFTLYVVSSLVLTIVACASGFFLTRSFIGG